VDASREKTISPEMLALLHKLRTKVAIGFVGGSDLVKQQEQLGVNGVNGTYFSPLLKKSSE
jgi:phosphomannomutase